MQLLPLPILAISLLGVALIGAVELVGLDLGPEGRQLRCHGVLALETAVGLAALRLITGHLQGMLVLFAVRGNAHLIGWLPDLCSLRYKSRDWWIWKG